MKANEKSVTLTREDVIQATDGGLEVFRHFLGPQWKPRKNFQNPFRGQQETPSFNVYPIEGTNEWAYKDFATGDQGSCLDLVMQLYGMPFTEALAYVCQELNLQTHSPVTPVITPTRRVLAPTVAPAVSVDEPSSISYRDGFLDDELAFWEQYGISLEVLETYGVRAVQEYSSKATTGEAYSVKSHPHQRIFAYVTDQASVKLYKPEAPKGRKFQ